MSETEQLQAPIKPKGPMREPGAPAVRAKPSATMILVRRDAEKPRVLMGRRARGHSFLPQMWVFPGGRLDRADHRAPVASDVNPEARAVFDAHLKPGLGRALALAAVRETWEEAGLLLAKPAPARPSAGPWREFLAQGVAPDLDALQVVARAKTPTMMTKRFDTWFLMAEAERLLTLERQPDCGELDEIAWLGFDETGDIKLAPITGFVLDEVRLRLEQAGRPRPHLAKGAGGPVTFL